MSRRIVTAREQVAVRSGAGDPNILAMSVTAMPLSRSWRALAASACRRPCVGVRPCVR